MEIIAFQNDGGWVAPAPPYTCEVIPQSMSSSEGTGRDVTGRLHIDRIAVKRTVHLTWNAVTPGEFAELCALTSPLTFRARVHDPTTMTLYEGEFYRGNDFIYNVVGPWDGDRWNGVSGISMTLTEV